ncbi:MAG: GNAT family N-acetyltransferase [Sphingomonas sp.]|nr:GNAT family N-acetyltransferase [Sphingomonas sp.]
MFARAFADEPALCWVFPNPGGRERRLRRLFAVLFDSDAGGVRLTMPDSAAATLWRPPGHADTTLAEMLRYAPQMLAAFGGAIGRGLALSKAIDAHFPPQPFWYLHLAGCDPAQQGRGLGRAVVQAGIDRMGGSGLPFYLETATERNIGFYQSLGFRVTSEWRVGRDGPVFWSMLNG